MSIRVHSEQEAVERFSRRSLWVALVILLLLGAFAFATLAGAGLPGWTGALVSIGISAAVVALGRRPGSAKAQRVVHEDELHARSVALAQRDALVAVLVAQPVFALATTRLSGSSAAALMACGTVTLASIVLVASLLLRDR